MTENTEVSPVFTGPLFLVGMPRSGTKLLCALLNRNPRIAISTIETDFFPYWVESWDSYGDLSGRGAFARFYVQARKLPFFTNLDSNSRTITEEDWYLQCRDFSAAGVFEALLRLESSAGSGAGKIWGDKSPSYTRHIALLKTHYPDAKFIHIIRDVRDFCLSINKAWGKNMIRAAQRWTDDVGGARSAGENIRDDYIEVRYEDLLDNPGLVMGRLCAFLGIEYDENMTQLSKPTEWVGDATSAEIKKDNVQKYVRKMKPSVRRKIEAIAQRVLEALGYPVDSTLKPARISAARMSVYQIADAIGLFKSSIRERGFWGAVRWNFRALVIKR